MNVLIKSSDFRGDHSADVFVAIDVPPECTIKELAEMVFRDGIGIKVGNGDATRVFDPINDHIEIRLPNQLSPELLKED